MAAKAGFKGMQGQPGAWGVFLNGCILCCLSV